MSAHLAVASVENPVRATIAFGADSSSHLYRGVSSPNPIGIVVRSPLEPPLSSAALLSLHLPFNEVHDCRALLHWSSPIGNFEFWLGFRLINSSRALCLALGRLALDYPTRLYDEWTESGRSRDCADPDMTCPRTLRSGCRALAESRSQPPSGHFAIVDDTAHVRFTALNHPRHGIVIARPGSDDPSDG